ncbi:3,4-dihydroxy-2-butanone-4-phosphate synthase [Thaumasiovibrio subtropicus]|uniref:3,4-dihydroxy-2-butanone-4-phosphate synthase n=1 Tax=Thaumasiovibrio subtropicus TaxID=1891207 RepID=UPI000B35F39B|nr:3,4-dihydroxy-2-butanone-4-phosphate synthase [Thaumasiovibrio subtropicus]
MNQNPQHDSLLAPFGNPIERVEAGIKALQQGQGILVLDDEDRENEGDLIYSAESMTPAQMALMIRECSGIVCLCLTDEQAEQLALPPMVQNNNSQNQTAFTVSIEAKVGVTTGVSAADRVTTIKTAINPTAKPEDLARPGHVFPLRARKGGVLERRGHTEGTTDMMKLAGLNPAGVLCEVQNEDGTMARTAEIVAFANTHNMPVLTIEDIVAYRQSLLAKTA